jgi:hypothetical protein
MQRTRVYRVATDTPTGWYWTCAWCFTYAGAGAPTWEAAVDALMEDHTPVCAPYQVWVQGLKQRTQQWAHPRRPRVHNEDSKQDSLF